MKTVQELSKNQIKLIKSLGIKKYRNKNNLFIAEGRKVIEELIDSDFEIERCFVVEQEMANQIDQAQLISTSDLKRISQLSTPHFGLAIVKIPLPNGPITEDLNLVLDGIADPGNLGTIIRLADWYGLKQISCINNCVDPFSPKVVQASMGSIFRIRLVETNAETLKWNSHVYGTFMSGKNASTHVPKFPCNLVIGNEANGISKEVETICSEKLTIKKYGQAESLNAGIATGILLDRFKQNLDD
ncbi:MAG: RNA methyltransferase [Bacteroidia bacterium]